MSETPDIGHLLYELCTRLGFCLGPEDQTRLIAAPPDGVDAFTDAVIEAEGLDVRTIDKKLRLQVRALVARHLDVP